LTQRWPEDWPAAGVKGYEETAALLFSLLRVIDDDGMAGLL